MRTVDESDETQREVAEAQAREPPKERLEREHSELIEELRALIPGAEVLFGFLLVIRFTNQFRDLDAGQRNAYYGTLISTAMALVLFLAPSAHHRLRFREGDKDYMLRKGNREAIVGTVAMALAFTGAIYLVTDLVFGTLAAGLAAAGDLRPDRMALVGARAVPAPHRRRRARRHGRSWIRTRDLRLIRAAL